MKKCSIEGCENKLLAKYLCVKHYNRCKKHGDPLIVTRRGRNLSDEEFIKWIKTKIRVNLETKCWEWRGVRDRDGYGQIKYKGKTIKVHRLHWFLTYGSWPKKFLLHSCDNPCCINLEHLREGSAQDNMDDKVEKNRQAKGKSNGASKLTEEKILRIRKLRKKKKYSVKYLAIKFNVSIVSINNICNRETWKHI